MVKIVLHASLAPRATVAGKETKCSETGDRRRGFVLPSATPVLYLTQPPTPPPPPPPLAFPLSISYQETEEESNQHSVARGT